MIINLSKRNGVKKMKVYELKIRTFLLEDIDSSDSLGFISKAIISYLSENEKFLDMHKAKNYKSYCHDNLYPIKKFYKKNMVYQYRIRSVDVDFVNYILHGFSDYKDKVFKNLTVDVRIIPKSPISKLFTLNPIIIKNDFGYWKDNSTLEEFEKRFTDNLIKKYKFFIDEKIEEGKFYTSLKFLNEGPITFKFKNIKLLGDKLELEINMDKRSQDLAYFALAVTFSENSAYGAGFLGYKYLI